MVGLGVSETTERIVEPHKLRLLLIRLAQRILSPMRYMIAVYLKISEERINMSVNKILIIASFVISAIVSIDLDKKYYFDIYEFLYFLFVSWRFLWIFMIMFTAEIC